MNVESNFHLSQITDNPQDQDLKPEDVHLSDFESPRETIKEVRGLFVKVMAEGLRETNITPKEEDFDFSKTSQVSYRLREYMTSSEVTDTTQETNQSEFGTYIRKEKDGITREMYIVESTVDSANTVSPTRKIRETILSLKNGNKQFVKESILSIVDGSGNSYDLNELLPGGTKLVPAGLDNAKTFNLSAYPGITESENDEFKFVNMRNEQEKIVYGNVATNRGLLTFLHETAHAWQSRFHPTAIENYQYSNKVVILTGNLCFFEYLLSSVDQLSPESVSEEIKNVASQYNKKPEEMVEYMKRYIVRNTPIVEGLGVTIAGLKITVENDSLKDRIADYVWAERQAWSTALRTYKMMQRKGLIPEPNNTESFTEEINSALTSYQKGLDFIEVKVDKPFALSSTSHAN